ncbi:MAG: hypothetical protein KatS3mg113_0537 [Planctomycetaceae bacterium]|nr:MAG: hypothetical protein KatS3mg113_0537 [Planctomycetaceae bacterium]
MDLGLPMVAGAGVSQLLMFEIHEHNEHEQSLAHCLQARAAFRIFFLNSWEIIA